MALAVGSQGDAVMRVQQALIDQGLDPGPVDGRFGPVLRMRSGRSRPTAASQSMESSATRLGRRSDSRAPCRGP
jgi:peptidoglycan hydrolase-like protein with peptidoglycan-binding domain